MNSIQSGIFRFKSKYIYNKKSPHFLDFVWHWQSKFPKIFLKNATHDAARDDIYFRIWRQFKCFHDKPHEKSFQKTPHMSYPNLTGTELLRFKLTLNRFPKLFLYESQCYDYHQV